MVDMIMYLYVNENNLLEKQIEKEETKVGRAWNQIRLCSTNETNKKMAEGIYTKTCMLVHTTVKMI